MSNIDKVQRDTIKIGDTLTYKQLYNLAKMEETIIAQMKVLSIDLSDETLINEFKCRPGQIAMTRTPKHNPTQNKKNRVSGLVNLPETRIKECYSCRRNHKYRNQCPTRSAQCWYCGKVGHYMQVCIKKKASTT